MKKLFIVTNVDTFFLSHRKEIALAALNEGFDVTVAALDTGRGADIRELGLKFVNLPINKTGLNLCEEVKTFCSLFSLFRKHRPDIVHAVGMKIILWGGLAARFCAVKGFVSAVSGLGVMFSPEYNRGWRKLISYSVLFAMRYIHGKKNTYCIFHNTDDMDMFVSNKIIDISRCVRTMGSGINLKEYSYFPELTEKKKRILFTARMVEDKGVKILIDAANRLKENYNGSIEFFLCGGLETNPMAVSSGYLNSMCDGTYIRWLGKRDDIHEQLEQCHIFAFPSYYKEGLPKSCIEAAAVGRPIITCDSTGCRDTVIDGKTGFLIPVKNSGVLAEKIAVLLENTELRKQMGYNARKFAEKNFSIETVVARHIEIYKDLLKIYGQNGEDL